MIVDLDMFRAGMKNQIRGMICGTDIVTPYMIEGESNQALSSFIRACIQINSVITSAIALYFGSMLHRDTIAFFIKKSKGLNSAGRI